MEFDSRWFTKQWDQPFKISRSEFQRRVKNVCNNVLTRLEVIHPSFAKKLTKWFSSNDMMSPECELHSVIADPYMMIEISEGFFVHDSKEYKFVNVVKIGITQFYQELGLCTALIDYLIHLTALFGYNRLVIESVINMVLFKMLDRRTKQPNSKWINEHCSNFSYLCE